MLEALIEFINGDDGFWFRVKTKGSSAPITGGSEAISQNTAVVYEIMILVKRGCGLHLQYTNLIKNVLTKHNSHKGI